jgi:seryl-tRNA synthetase
MLDINLIREKPQVVKKDLVKRGDKERLKWIDEIRKKDEQWRKLRQKADSLRKQRNIISLKINESKKAGKNIKELLKKAKEIPQKIEKGEEKAAGLKIEIDSRLTRLPNILDKSVPKGKDETQNKEIRKSGRIPKFNFQQKNHVELLEKLGMADFDRSGKISGNGFYFLKGDAVLLEQALLRFSLEIIRSKNYIPVYPPLMMRRKAYEGVTDLADFESMMYKIEDQDEYLIATSEHPLTAQHFNEVLEEKNLPFKYAGISPCFRKEIGTHGIDEKGVFRVHQFNKIEQIIICKPKDSWKLHEELIKNAEEIFKALGLPYRIVNICTGDIGTVAAKKYDLEAWLPHQKKYREMGSCSNCTNYQARRLKIRFRDKDGKLKLVHTLNSTAIAAGRALVAILENFQTEQGTVRIPKVLWPYMSGIKELKKK